MSISSIMALTVIAKYIELFSKEISKDIQLLKVKDNGYCSNWSVSFYSNPNSFEIKQIHSLTIYIALDFKTAIQFSILKTLTARSIRTF